MPLSYLPVGLRLEGRRCLIVGGGAVAYRKARALIERGAELTVIAVEHNAGIQQFVDQGQLTLISRAYESPEAENFGLVICATNNQAVNRAVYEDCVRAKVPVNVVDDPARCDFIFPAVIQRGSLSLAISTDGRAPFLTRHLRGMLEMVFGPQWELVTDLAEAFRTEVRRRFPDDPKQEQECFRRFLEIDWPALFSSQNSAEVEGKYHQLLNSL